MYISEVNKYHYYGYDVDAPQNLYVYGQKF